MDKLDTPKYHSEEIQKKFEADGYDWVEIKDSLEKIATQEEVDTKLDALEGNSYYVYLKGLIDTELKKGVVGNLTDKAKTAAGDAVDSATSAATEAVKGSLFSKIGAIKESVITKIAATFGLGATVTAFMSENINPVSWLKSGFTGDGFLGWIGGFLGFKKKEEPKPGEEKQGEKEDPAKTEIPAEIKNPPEDALEEESTAGDSLPGRFKAGAKLIVGLNTSMGDLGNDDPTSTYSALQKMSYSDIQKLSSDSIPSGFYPDDAGKGSPELYSKIVSSIQSEKTQDLLRIGLNNTSLKNIIMPFGEINPKLLKHFGETEEKGKERLEQILAASTDKNAWKNLSFKEISILYISSLPALRVPAAAGISDIASDINAMIFGENSPLSEENEDFDGPIPKDLLIGFGKLGDGLKYSTYMPNSSKDGELQSKVFEEMPNTSKQESEKVFERMMEFKTKIMSQDFVGNEKLGLKTPEQQKLFTDNMDLAYLIALYSILGGNSDLEKMSPLSLLPLLFTIGKIISKGSESNALDAGEYLGGYIKDMFVDGDAPLSDDEKKVLEIYGEKVMDMIFLSHFKSMAKLLGAQKSITGFNTSELAIGSFAGGAALNLTSRAIIKGALSKGNISLTGIWLKRAGNIGMLAGLILGGVSWFENKGSFDGFTRDLNAANNQQDFNKILATLKKQRDAIKPITLPGEQEAMVLAYPGDTPIYIIDGKVHVVKVGDNDFFERMKKSKEWNEYFSAITDSAKKIITESTGKIGGVDYRYQKQENGKIVFGTGKNTHSISLSELFNFKAEDKTIIGQDIVGKLTDGEDKLSIFGFDLGNEGEKGYVLKVLGDNDKIMYLAELGNAEELFNPSTHSK